MNLSHYLAHSNALLSLLKIVKPDHLVNSQIFKLICFFSNGNRPKQLDKFSQKIISVNPCNTRSEEQLHIPKIDIFKYGSRSLTLLLPVTDRSISKTMRVNIGFTRKHFLKSIR